MPNLQFPDILLKLTSLSWQIVNTSRNGGAGITGARQVIREPAGVWVTRWTLNVGAMPWNGSDELLAYQGFMADLGGSAGIVDLPYFDARGPAQLMGLDGTVSYSDGSVHSDGTGYAQGSTPAVLGADAEMNATLVTLTYPTGFRPHMGQCFTMPDGWMHRIARVVANSGLDWTVRISPWLQGDYAAGASVEVDRPTCPMRLINDTSGRLEIQAGQAWSAPVLEFEEAR